ncbi:MAG: hypothetical protein KC458_03130, partial [Dehalococcoidia bacterium]|nr:hypothetical protein [Dehalococcoidia bacterium]
AGAKRAIDRSATDLASIAPFVDAPAGAWGALRRAQGDSERTVVRAGVAPTATPTLLERVEQAGGTGWTNIAPGAVVAILPEPTAEAIESLRSEAERLGGFLQVESAPAELRRQVAPSPGDTVLVEALRDRFDAKRTINRGRWGAVL